MEANEREAARMAATPSLRPLAQPPHYGDYIPDLGPVKLNKVARGDFLLPLRNDVLARARRGGRPLRSFVYLDISRRVNLALP